MRMLRSPRVFCAVLLCAVMAISFCSCGFFGADIIPFSGLFAGAARHDTARADKPLAPDPIQDAPPASAGDALAVLRSAFSGGDYAFLNAGFIGWLGETFGTDIYDKICSSPLLCPGGAAPDKSAFWYSLCGMTEHVLYDLRDKIINADEANAGSGEAVTLLFAGDICLADDWENMRALASKGGALPECVAGGLLDIMRAADITYANSEFCFSERGEPLEGKYYAFRSKPGNVSLLLDMGIDIVSLANNHCFDYGGEAFLDTLATLSGAKIRYAGAGRDIAEASSPVYIYAGGMKIAFVAASRAEKMPFTPGAGKNSAGVLLTYDPALFAAAIAEAAENADYVVACPHWGTENTEVLERAQLEQAKTYIEAGADAVVGAHPHCLQPFAYYKGSVIAYSLGNFWFNAEDGDTALFEITLAPSESRARIIPCTQSGGVTSPASADDAARILAYLQSVSPDAKITAEGVLTSARPRCEPPK